MTLLLLTLAVAVFSVLGGLASRAMSTSLPGKQLRVLAAVGAGLLLASTLIVLIPEGFRTAALTSEEQLEVASDAEADGEDGALFTHDAEEPLFVDDGSRFVVASELLGLTILVGLAAMLLVERAGAGVLVRSLAGGLASGSIAISSGLGLAILVGFVAIAHHISVGARLGDSRQARRDKVLFSVVIVVATALSYLALEGGSETALSVTLLFSAGVFISAAVVSATGLFERSPTL